MLRWHAAENNAIFLLLVRVCGAGGRILGATLLPTHVCSSKMDSPLLRSSVEMPAAVGRLPAPQLQPQRGAALFAAHKAPSLRVGLDSGVEVLGKEVQQWTLGRPSEGTGPSWANNPEASSFGPLLCPDFLGSRVRQGLARGQKPQQHLNSKVLQWRHR